ncbi:amidohydrolase [Prosthecochloris sp. GSB1]|uniref:M20 metallopeptidase family protein n=1 Tax=Prosthecochloris sp. GSB1 TaxID=281093 RepID=UPI000B8CE98F|nr:M20 family metallopeptidase [Prosthecochloris sp. GSB1]ASQ90558.1 amidohydrolase [Prosthecochloris sp. GSB1]
MTYNPSVLRQRIRDKAAELHPGIVSIRRDIHMHPELSFREFRTTALVREYLLGLGLRIEHEYLETGVVARLESGTEAQRLPLVALRADMDALPVPEENSHDFCSVEKGVMHACGHDMHTAILMGAAAILASMKEQLPGDVLFIFQPAEEKAPGGAVPLIEAGLFRDYDPSAIFALHCFPHILAGNVAVREGSLMAAADELYITVHGEGGHASAPHKASDPVLGAAHIVTAVQHLVSRASSPYEPAVVSISSIQGGSATNVIPGRVSMSGTMRSMSEELRALLQKRLAGTVEHIAAGLGVRGELDIVSGYPVLVNDPETSRFVRSELEGFLGREHVEESEPLMTAEDFSSYLRYCPGTFIQLGTGRPGQSRGNALHSPFFNPDESALRTGMEVMSCVALGWLEKSVGEG